MAVDLSRFSDCAIVTMDFWLEDRAIRDPGFVYFIQAEGGGPVKIGRARDPKGRLGELQVGHPERLFVRALLFGWEYTEKGRHLEWHSARVRGEWFGRGLEDLILEVAWVQSEWQMSARVDPSASYMGLRAIAEMIPADAYAAATGGSV